MIKNMNPQDVKELLEILILSYRYFNRKKEQQLRELDSIKASDLWKIGSLYYKLRESNYLIHLTHKFSQNIKKAILIFLVNKNQSELKNDREEFNNVKNFIQKYKRKRLYIFYSNFQYTVAEGKNQRPAALARQFSSFEIPCIYVYYHWQENIPPDHGEVEKGIFVLTRSQFIRCYLDIFNTIKAFGKEIVFFIEYPDIEIIPIFVEAKLNKFTTVYDVIDNWEELYKKGASLTFYDKRIEDFLLKNSTYRFATTDSLRNKFGKFNIEIVPNGFDPNMLKEYPEVDLETGEITIGYYGVLDNYIFDWNLIVKTAQQKPTWYFHIFGYYMPDKLVLPDNIKFHGKIPPEQLSGFVKKWDVCLVPFVKSEISQVVDPIKVYEYLYFQKPTVVTGIPKLRGLPYVIATSNNPSSFISAIIKASTMRIDPHVIKVFLTPRTWYRRAKEIQYYMRT